MKSFLYKMLRKKNIVLNGKKADGNEKIKAGDSVKIFFSDETFEKFSDEMQSRFASFKGALLDNLYAANSIIQQLEVTIKEA